MNAVLILILAVICLVISLLLSLLVVGHILIPVLGVMFAACMVLLVLGLYIGSLAWAYRGAQARGKPGWAVALLVALAYWPLSLLAWYVFRPDKKTPASSGSMVLPPVNAPGHS
jgi:hypothetical protein